MNDKEAINNSMFFQALYELKSSFNKAIDVFGDDEKIKAKYGDLIDFLETEREKRR